MTHTVAEPELPPSSGGLGRAAIWVPGLVVALGAAVATMHGLYEVARAARVPAEIAWLYPLITDGLALVAYAATARLSGSAARYAWMVVVLAAGLSGLAQAIYLASDHPAGPPAQFEVSPVLRFGVGAWPAIAAAVVAHLLYLILADRPEADERPNVQASVVQSERVQPDDRAAVAERSAIPELPAPSSEPEAFNIEPSTRPLPASGGAQRSESRSGSSPARDRAVAAASRHARRHGALPTVTQLQELADVSRGTAGEVLKGLRAQPAPLHLVSESPSTRTQP